MRVGSALGGTVSVTALTVIAALALWLAGRRDHALFVAVLVLAGAMAGPLLKEVVGRPRPPSCAALIEMPTSLSFPSGHTLESLLCFGAIALSASALLGSPWKQAIGIVAAVCVVWVAASRVYLGVHWATDVLASWALGGALLLATVALLRQAARTEGA
jgi:undecaprenyl-diphosphatase